jgi:hypothetical protein
VHEAGHAIVAWALGLKVGELRIDDQGKGLSVIQRHDHLPIVERIAVADAGMQAVEMLKARVWEWAAVGDEAQIIDILGGKPEAESTQLRSQGAAQALAILNARMDVLTDLADMLFRSMALDAAALEGFARRALS